MESVKESHPNVGLKSSDTERNPIGRRTQSDQTANAIRSDGGRNPIRRRTQTATILYTSHLSASPLLPKKQLITNILSIFVHVKTAYSFHRLAYLGLMISSQK